MYELSRVRLHAVGPKGARYQDVTLDLRRDATGQPSPATVLFLDNGGGKTVLVRLIFSVILPGKRQVVGTTSSKVLQKFVLANDVAHVAIEWRDTRSGQLLVTGKSSEWQGHVVSADSSKLTERWYTFRPNATLSLDALPFTQNGRIMSLAGFHERLGEADKADQTLRVVWEGNRTDWTKHLDSLLLDPELFRYQRKMNAGEGEAADAFTFKTDEAFVEWLLTAIIPDEEPQSMGEVVTEYAASLASRGKLTAERYFVQGALERLGPLVQAAGERDAALSLHRDVLEDAERFVVALKERLDEETGRHIILSGQLEEVDGRERTLDQEERRLNQVVIELSRLTAKLRWESAIVEQKCLEDELGGTRTLVEAWTATDAVVRYRMAQGAADAIRELVHQQEDEAEPVLRVRQGAARRFVRGLIAIATAADDEASFCDARADRLGGEIAEAEGKAREAIKESADANARIETASNNIGEVQSAIRTAVDAGLLAESEDVAEAARLAADMAGTAETEATEALEQVTALEVARDEASANLETARIDRESQERIAEALGKELSDSQVAADELRHESRLTSLLGAEEVILDSDVPALIELLTEAISQGKNEADKARVEAVTDERVLAALGEGGLLPPGDDIATALQILADQRITSWSGWQYLARIRADERDQVLARCPQLVDGIVLNSGDDLEAARERLTAARLLPRTLVAIGTTASLRNPDVDEPAGIEFIIPPNPAMYDEERAEEVRQLIQLRSEQRHARIAHLESTVAADGDLIRRLKDWRKKYPPGRIGQLTEDHRRANEDWGAAKALEGQRRDALTKLATQAKQLKQQILGLGKIARDTRRKADSLGSLASAYAKIAGLQEIIRGSKGDYTRAEQEAALQYELADKLRTEQSEAHRAADDQRRTAGQCRSEIGDVIDGGSVDEDTPVPDESLETLRAAYRTATAAYEKVEVGADLRAEVNRLGKAESDARVAMEKLDRKVRDRAEELLMLPDGSDASARAEAVARYKRQAANVEEQVKSAAGLVGKLKQAYESYQPQDRSLEPYGKPQDIPHGEELIARASVDRERVHKDHGEIIERQNQLKTQMASIDALVSDLDAVRDSLSALVAPVSDRAARPFAGTVDLARARRGEIREAMSQAKQLVDQATAQVRTAADGLAHHATDDRFEKVAAPVRRQMLATDRERLPDFAADWETALRPRLRVLTDELEQIERHRDAIIERLLGMVKHALGRLKAAQRASRLPADFGDWSGLEFLRIAFISPDEAVMTESLGQVIDEAALASNGKDKDLGKRDGLSILLSGVKACLRPRGVRVDMLKPDAVLRDERVRVAEMAEVFSGGQLLTAAIILYCTMAWLRASERGQVQRSHAGVLFLDNPIGRASAGYLLELQMTVARKLGVQLVYTTGLFDTNALSVFPLIVRLRNDADLRAGMKYLRVDQEIRMRLPDAPPDETGVLTASRLFAHTKDRQP